MKILFLDKGLIADFALRGMLLVDVIGHRFGIREPSIAMRTLFVCILFRTSLFIKLHDMICIMGEDCMNKVDICVSATIFRTLKTLIIDCSIFFDVIMT